MTVHIWDALLYGVGFAAVLVTFWPFSPMTIDWLILPRTAQIAIFRRRHLLWGVAFVCLAGLLARGLLGWSDAAWPWTAAATAAVLVMMFWGAYVPWVMTPPGASRRLSAEEAQARLAPEDAVLGVVHSGEARAYLRDQIARPHFFNDTVGGARLTVSYCILCNSAMAFRAELAGRPLELACVTANNNNMIYVDPARGNFVQQLDLSVFFGPDAGQALDPHPVTVTTWAEWRRLHPGTELYWSPPTALRDKMVAAMLDWMVPIRKLARRTRPFHRIKAKPDARLPAMSYVVGVEHGGESCAYPLAELSERRMWNDTVGDEPVVLFGGAEGEVAQVFSRTVDGRVLSFRPPRGDDPEVVAEDEETASRWDLGGRAREGELAGRELAPVPNWNRVFWFSWTLFKPGTRLAGSS